MRLAHAIFLVAVIALIMAIAREPIGRVFLIVFATGLGEFALGLGAVMALFQTVGAFGEAKSLVSHLQAVVETTVVLALGTASMSGWLFAGAWLVSVAV
jgi:hypothetical protein